MLSAVQNWYDQNSLDVNPSKTEMMTFGLPKRENRSNITVNFGGVQARPVNNMKVLGVTLDPELRWEDHVSTVTRKSYATLAQGWRFWFFIGVAHAYGHCAMTRGPNHLCTRRDRTCPSSP